MSDTPNSLFNQSLEKGLAVLRAFNAAQRTMNLAEIAEAAEINKSSAQRMIHTLEQLGYVRKHPQTKRFQLTPRVMEIGYNYLAADTLVDVANPFLAELAQVTGETTNLTEPDGLDMVYVARFVAPKFIPIHMPIGSRIPMYCTGSGRAYLSALPDQEALAMLQASDRQAHTRHTLTEIDAIHGQIVATRQRGYALNQEELFLGDMSIAAPIIGSQGLPVAAVHVVIPSSRWTLEEAERKLAPSVIECARAIRTSIRTL
ncbi:MULTISPECIES: IclR family transcriptional regulator [Pseudomonas]|uniref:Pca regulon regulatory protein PcaR n=1 Tax=Pseudomonas chlororaphis TaxID=587753 RepID=A0AAX3G395_9PSED|nr:MULTISPECIES: IclR family transcriptional regulator [Pseudomonas]AVO58395.1 IclR family transcriptional regulator [Pseudomonas chlororaphis subsp. piscium]AZC36654.1 Transcriptional regulator, IclR family [Pseudomonas chlororaphis subsp. piscium]AZC43199.1 Transcriptional regulator, IclR family [Pseudomonas chlororaphis subsp. piscium]AZC49885.1 Transcriptional regulator, IclR family [Pseudomonas chlororaphis subsp. piscium]AZC62684.1 Transcriptional regulator, IclR family [Pseudomonas chlo